MKEYLSASRLILFIFTGLFFFSTGVSADDISWHRDSRSFRVYLGVVPALLIKTNPRLVDGDTKLHGGVKPNDYSKQHVMVSIHGKEKNKRILDATVVASVQKSGFFSGRNITKPMEKMVTSGKITYGNYFNMPEKGKYKIVIKIFRPNMNGSEDVEFVYMRP